MCQWSGKHITMLGPRRINRSSLSWGRAFERTIFLGFPRKMFYESSFQLRKGCSGVNGDCTRHTAHAAFLERWRTLWGLALAGTSSTVERVIERCRGFVHVWSFRALLFRVHVGISHQTVDAILFSFFCEVLLFLEILLLPPVTSSFFSKFIGDLERSDNWTLHWGFRIFGASCMKFFEFLILQFWKKKKEWPKASSWWDPRKICRINRNNLKREPERADFPCFEAFSSFTHWRSHSTTVGWKEGLKLSLQCFQEVEKSLFYELACFMARKLWGAGK